MSKVKISVALAWLIAGAPLLLAATLSIKEIGFPATVAPHSAYYRIEATVGWAVEPGFLKFGISSAHAHYEVEGLVPLFKLLHEIEVIERISRDEEGSGFTEGLTDSIKQTGQGFVQLVSHPVDSTKSAGKAIGELGRKLGSIFQSQEEGEKTSFEEKVLGASEREIAAKFGVDVYTSNPNLQVLLSRMARARVGGKGTAFVVKMLLPVAGLVSAAVTVSGLNGAADQFVNDKSRRDLYDFNYDALLDLGFSDSEVLGFLNNPFYTPREATYLRFYLEKLKNVFGARDILRQAAGVKNLWQARKLLYETQLAADLMKTAAPYGKMQVFREGLAVLDSSRVIFITPYDYLEHNSLGDQVVKRALEIGKIWERPSLAIWNGGKITSAYRRELLRKGIQNQDWLLLAQPRGI